MPPTPHRFPVLDVLRGFAICGILLVNIPDIAHLGHDALRQPASREQLALYYLVSARFVPIFAFLFGCSLAFVRDSARRRAGRAWPVLCRRLVVLAVVGLLHQLLYPGEVLTFYAVVGLIVLPVVLRSPQRLLLVLGLVLTVASYAVSGGGPVTLPGLFLLGAAAVGHGWPAHLEAGDRPIIITAAAAAAASGAAVWWQTTQPGDPRFTLAGGIAGGAMAVLYTTMLSLLWHTPARHLLQALFAPLGRAAFTCYLTATLLVIPAGHWLDLRHTNDLTPALLLALGVLVVQNLLMRLWFSHFTYGPLEWPWRAITWWHNPNTLPTTTTPQRAPITQGAA